MLKQATRAAIFAAFFLLVLLPALAHAEDSGRDDTGTLAGQVVSLEGGEPVEGARVFVRGLDVEAKTDADGRFELEVPVGTWDVWVIHSQFSTASRDGVDVVADEPTDIDFELTPTSVRLDAFTVTIPRIEGGTISLLEERRETNQVADVIGAEQFSQSGDSDAASALGRVTGLTVVDGKHVYVRGLGERYASSLLNGSMLPSPDPERRVVPLDLFPTSILESVVVQKTYSADMPGGFGGGVIGMRTRSFPSEFTLNVDLSVGGNTMTTLQDGLTYRGGSYDWLGFDDGTRALPGRVKRAAAKSPLKKSGTFSDDGYTAEELEEIGEAMPNNYSTHRETVLPDIGVSADVGDTVDLLGWDVGYRLALGYDNAHDVNRWNEVFYLEPTQTEFSEYDFNERTDTVTLSGMFVGGVQFDEQNKIELTSLVSRLTDDTARSYQGHFEDTGEDIRIGWIRWLERQLMFHQLRGEHELDWWTGPKINWRYGYGRATRDEPDRRNYRYDWQPRLDDWVLSNRPDGNSRLYSELADNSHDMGLAATFPIDVWGELEAELKLGADFLYKDRVVSTRRFAFKAEPPPSEEERTQAPEELLTADNIGPDGYQLLETTRSTDNYSAQHTILAPYLVGTLPLTETVSLTAGARLEKSRQEVITEPLFSDEVESTVLDRTDVLGSAGATWEFAEDMQLRTAVARTINRPDFRELSPSCFTSVVGGRQTCGNAQLDPAHITHYDARWEWYPDRGESVSVGGFVKNFSRPIEVVLEAGTPPRESFQNTEGATNLGIEFDARKRLGILGTGMRDFYMAGNLALIWSQIDIGESEVLTSTQRALQGQSPYVLNMQFGYTNEDIGTTAAMLYNVYGRRIVRVGGYGMADTYEEPRHTVDMTFSQKLGEQFKLGLKAKNLLDVAQPETVGSLDSRRQLQGRSVSLKLSWDY
ncbi:MAG: TonB-dependent receptor domain-containing protein [Persicimonas sp.]